MTIEVFTIIALILTLIVQQIFWAKVCSDLANKLMSRNYYEYVQAKALKTQIVQKPQEEEKDFEAERQAQELNSLMGMV